MWFSSNSKATILVDFVNITLVLLETEWRCNIDYNSLNKDLAEQQKEKTEVFDMKEIEAIDQLKLIRDNIEKPIPEYTRTGLSITALTYGIEAIESIQPIKSRFVDGREVNYQGDDADDGIECPFCGYEVARNDDYPEIRPKHCPECGTKLIY